MSGNTPWCTIPQFSTKYDCELHGGVWSGPDGNGDEEDEGGYTTTGSYTYEHGPIIEVDLIATVDFGSRQIFHHQVVLSHL